jgi:2-polyprenyl-3-methyl-5-hydroxy-6-metoxy-1,4-benzoquinol methylase
MADILPRPENLPGVIPWHRLDLNDADAIPAASFDVVIAAEVMEHLENPRQVALESFQILKTGGTLILSTPNNEHPVVDGIVAPGTLRRFPRQLLPGALSPHCFARIWCAF